MQLLMMIIVSLFLILVSPIREVTKYSPILNDVQSQLKANHSYGCSDPISTVHECTHGINARLRQIHNKPCFYVLNNKAFILKSKGILKDVADAVPKKFRKSQYQWYLVDRQRWRDKKARVWVNERYRFWLSSSAQNVLVMH